MVSDFQGAIDTFTRPFTIYQEATRTVIQADPNWNPYSYSQTTTGTQYTPNPVVISGRILYDKQQEWGFVRPYVGRGPNEGQLKIKDQTTRAVRIKVDASGASVLQLGKKFVIDGLNFDLESQQRPHGLFGAETYTFYFVRSL